LFAKKGKNKKKEKGGETPPPRMKDCEVKNVGPDQAGGKGSGERIVMSGGVNKSE